VTPLQLTVVDATRELQAHFGRLEFGPGHPTHTADGTRFQVALDLRFDGDPVAWTQGHNDRFVYITRKAGEGLAMSFATGPSRCTETACELQLSLVRPSGVVAVHEARSPQQLRSI
jgi:hypothetical protein